MATKKIDTENKSQDLKVKDYGDAELNSLAVLLTTLDGMASEHRHRAFKYLKSRYSKDWPSNDEGY